MITAKIDPAQFRQMGRVISRFRRKVEGDLLRRIGDRIAKQTRDRIRAGGPSPDGHQWWPRVDGSRNHLLIESRRLLNSIRAARESKGLINIGTDVIYGKYHQTGTSRMPDRPFLGVSQKNKEDLEQFCQAWVDKNFS